MIISEPYNVMGGPRPKSLADLKAEGIKRIISLQSGAYQTLLVLENNRDPLMYQYPCEYGMQEYNMPCSDVMAPDPAYVNKILKLVADGIPTFIHCETGRDRTGFVGAVIKMRFDRMPYKDALAWWREIRHPWYFYWEPQLEAWSIR